MSKVTERIKQRSGESKEFAEAYMAESNRLDVSVMLYNLRKNMGLSQADFAKKVGVPQSTISRLETGKFNPTIDFISDILAKIDKK